MAPRVQDLVQRLDEMEKRLLQLEQSQRNQQGRDSATPNTWQFTAEQLYDDRMVLRLWKGPLGERYGQPLRPPSSSGAAPQAKRSNVTPTSSQRATPSSLTPLWSMLKHRFPNQPASLHGAELEGSLRRSQPRRRTSVVHSGDDNAEDDNGDDEDEEDDNDNDDDDCEEIAIRNTPPGPSQILEGEKLKLDQHFLAKGIATSKRPRSPSLVTNQDSIDDSADEPVRKKSCKRVSFADEFDGAPATFETGSAFGSIVLGTDPQAAQQGEDGQSSNENDSLGRWTI